MLHDLEKAVTQLQFKKPLVLCLTNHVTMDFMANCLLSLGAAPIMTQDIRELDELVSICHAVNVNIGTLDMSFMERAHAAVSLAQRYNKPIVLDPVGAGATQIRTTSSRELMKSAAIIRGNASEILALGDNIHKTLGVESTHQVSDAISSARALASNLECTIVVSGEEDFITNGNHEKHLTFGSSLMPLVTGMGCALTAVIAAFQAITTDSYQAACFGTAYFSLCGSLAETKATTPGSFRSLFLDELYRADFVDMRVIINAK